MINSNVDQYGIPYRGFIKADKIRARQVRERSESATLMTKAEPPRANHLIGSLRASNASTVGFAVLFMLVSVLAYVAGENRGASSASIDAGVKVEMTAVSPIGTPVAKDEIQIDKNIKTQALVQQHDFVRQKAIQQEVILQEVGQQALVPQNMAQATRQSLLRLKQTLDPQGNNVRLNINTGVIGDYSSRLSDSLSGNSVNQVDPELEKLRLRVINMIDAQSEMELAGQ